MNIDELLTTNGFECNLRLPARSAYSRGREQVDVQLIEGHEPGWVYYPDALGMVASTGFGAAELAPLVRRALEAT
jgi:hypothetical protein